MKTTITGLIQQIGMLPGVQKVIEIEQQITRPGTQVVRVQVTITTEPPEEEAPQRISLPVVPPPGKSETVL